MVVSDRNFAFSSAGCRFCRCAGDHFFDQRRTDAHCRRRPDGKNRATFKANLSAEKMREKAMKAAKESLQNITVSQEEKMKRDMAQFEDSFVFVDYYAESKSTEQIERELGGKIRDGEIRCLFNCSRKLRR